MLGFFSRIFSRPEPETRAGVIATGNLTDTDDFWYGIGGFDSASGVMVSKQSAMRQWAVYSCITEIAQTIAQLPLKLKRPDGKGGTEDAVDHPAFYVCKTLPNKRMVSFVYREAQTANLLLDGNCYSYIDRSRHLGIKALWPLAVDTVDMRTASRREISYFSLPKDDRIVYDVQTVDGVKTYPAKDILHIVGFGYDGLKGESVITNFAKETIGNAIGLDKFQGAAMKNGTYPSGVIEHPETLGDTKDDFVAALDARYSGLSNVKRPMIFENGMKFNKVDVSLVDKQFIEQMRMTASQISGIFKVPPHRIGIYEKNTNYNNTEQGNKAFLDGCIQQWVTRWEETLNWKLLTDAERMAGYQFKFNFDALLRPDAKTRSDISWREWQMGVPLNVIRKRNDENPVDGGDVSFVPANVIPAHLSGQQQNQQNQAQEDLQDKSIDDVRKYERNAISRLIEKNNAGKCKDFSGGIDEIYNKIDRMLANEVRMVVSCFNDEESTNTIISKYRDEFNENRRKMLEARRQAIETWGHSEK